MSKAKKKYEDKRVIKRVSFNVETEKMLLEFADKIDFSKWVKQLIDGAPKPVSVGVESDHGVLLHFGSEADRTNFLKSIGAKK